MIRCIRGGVRVFNHPPDFPLTEEETEIVGSSRRRERAGLGPTLANTKVTEKNAHLVATIFQAGLEVNGQWNSPTCCATCPNKNEFIELFLSDSTPT